MNVFDPKLFLPDRKNRLTSLQAFAEDPHRFFLHFYGGHSKSPSSYEVILNPFRLLPKKMISVNVYMKIPPSALCQGGWGDFHASLCPPVNMDVNLSILMFSLHQGEGKELPYPLLCSVSDGRFSLLQRLPGVDRQFLLPLAHTSGKELNADTAAIPH